MLLPSTGFTWTTFWSNEARFTRGTRMTVPEIWAGSSAPMSRSTAMIEAYSVPWAPDTIASTGPTGWRAGWRFLLFFTIVFVSAKVLDGLITQVGGYQEPRGEWSAAGLLIDAALTFAAVVVGMGVMARLERRSLADYGLPLRTGSGARFAEGVLWGLAASTFLLLMIWLCGGASVHGVTRLPGVARSL